MQPLLKQTLNPGGFRILEKNSKRSLEPGKLARLGSQTSLEERGSSRYDHLPRCWDQAAKAALPREVKGMALHVLSTSRGHGHTVQHPHKLYLPSMATVGGKFLRLMTYNATFVDTKAAKVKL